MAKPARKFAADELKKISQAIKKSQPADNIVDFNRYKRALEQNRLAAKRARTEAEIAKQYKEGTPMAGVSPSTGLTGGIPQDEEGPAAAEKQPLPQKSSALEKEFSPPEPSAPSPRSEPLTPTSQPAISQQNIPQTNKAETKLPKSDQAKTGGRKADQSPGESTLPITTRGLNQPSAGTKTSAQLERSFARKFRRVIRTKKEAEAALEKAGLTKTDNIGVIGKILFVPLLTLHIFADILPFVTIETSSIIDWILDIGLFIAVAIVLFIITGDIIKAFTSRRAAMNAAKTLIEIIPGLGIFPVHTLVLGIIYVDLQYNFISKIPVLKYFKKTPGEK